MLFIRENPSGSVSLICRFKCATKDITLALSRAVSHDDPWELAAEWERIAMAMRELAVSAIAELDKVAAA